MKKKRLDEIGVMESENGPMTFAKVSISKENTIQDTQKMISLLKFFSLLAHSHICYMVRTI